MGQPAYCNAHVRFNNVENRRAAEILFTEWAETANKGEHPEPDSGDFCIEGINGFRDEIQFTVKTGRYQNCIWQCERIRDFFMKQQGCVAIEQDVITCEDSVNWYGDDEE